MNIKTIVTSLGAAAGPVAFLVLFLLVWLSKQLFDGTCQYRARKKEENHARVLKYFAEQDPVIKREKRVKKTAESSIAMGRQFGMDGESAYMYARKAAQQHLDDLNDPEAMRQARSSNIAWGVNQNQKEHYRAVIRYIERVAAKKPE
jgi:hypothetical protein